MKLQARNLIVAAALILLATSYFAFARRKFATTVSVNVAGLASASGADNWDIPVN